MRNNGKPGAAAKPPNRWDKEKRTDWTREHYKRLVADVGKQTAEALAERLKQDNMSFQAWLKEQIQKYL